MSEARHRRARDLSPLDPANQGLFLVVGVDAGRDELPSSKNRRRCDAGCARSAPRVGTRRPERGGRRRPRTIEILRTSPWSAR